MKGCILIRLLALSGLLAIFIGCATEDEQPGGPSKEFVDEQVERIGTVETSEGPVELGRRKVKVFDPRAYESTSIQTLEGPLKRGASDWYPRVMLVPGYGLVGLEFERDLENRRGSGTGMRAIRIVPKEPGLWHAENDDLVLPDGGYQRRWRMIGAFLEVQIGPDRLRPERCLLAMTYSDVGNQHKQTFRLIAYRKGSPPEPFPHVENLIKSQIEGLALRAEQVGDVIVVSMAVKERTKRLFTLDSQFKPLGDLPAETVRFPIYDYEGKAGAYLLPGLYGIRSKTTPVIEAVLGPDGKFGAPEFSGGMIPVFVDYRGEPAVAVWVVPMATTEGVRFGLCRGDRTGWSGPVYKDIRIEYGPALQKAAHRDHWLLIQSADSTWSATIPGPSPGGLVFKDLPPILGKATVGAAFAAAEKQMAAINDLNARNDEAARARAAKAWEEFRAQQAALTERERQNSWFGTENLIYGKPREQTVGEFLDERMRQAIKDMKDRGVYDQYGKPYNWLNK